MRIKTFEGKTENEALEKVKAEIGQDATILNIRKINKKGFMSLFNSSKVEVTVAVDNDKEEFDKTKIKSNITNESNSSNTQAQQDDKILIDEKLKEKEKLIVDQKKQIEQLSAKVSNNDELIATLTKDIIEATSQRNQSLNNYDNEVLQTLYDALVSQGVYDYVAHAILEPMKSINRNTLDLNYGVKCLFDKIVEIIGEPNTVDIDPYGNNNKFVVFMGSTGVGKTTTIAKLASKFILEDDLDLGLVTCDTYRIAAVEQLRTYADILGINLNVAYSPEEMQNFVEDLKISNDLILVDTAGRSHRNIENIKDIKSIVDVTENSQKFLVVSLSTKSEDIIDTVNTYSEQFDFSVLFTKMDETISLGSVVNVCYVTKKRVSYITNGQSVPSDISKLDGKMVAKAILGLGGN